ncbi:MAG: glycosyltransferase family 4 protein [Bacteroidetes bacterium]|nr:glycosyltransferase family 4 protein [Bacteroidota bacterium]
MNVLYCVPALFNPGGMERILTEKANYLALIPGYEVTIVTTDQMGRPTYFELNSKIKIVHLDLDFDSHFTDRLLKKYISHKLKIRRYRKALLHIINERKIDICLSLCGKEIDFLATLPVNCKKIAEIHFSMNFRKQFLEARKKGLVWKLLGQIRTIQLKRSVKLLDKLIVLTEKDMLQWKKTHSNIVNIPNFSFFDNPKLSNSDTKTVITVGKLDAQKGYDMLVEAWAIVAKKHPDWTLNIFGTGEWNEKIGNRISDLNMLDQIKLRGVTNDVLSEYSKSAFYVMSSRYEGLPMVLIEAMTCGLPVVSFDCEYGPSEIITNNLDGFLVENGNIVQLAEKICILIEDDALRKKMGELALQKVKNFSKEPIMAQWTELFKSLTAK